MKEKQTQAERIISKFGGRAALVAALKPNTHRISHQVVYNWEKREKIPASWWKQIIVAGKKQGLSITADEFLKP